MRHYFTDIETGTNFCIRVHRDGTASFRHIDYSNGKRKQVTKTYKDYTTARRALGIYTGGWAREVKC